MSRILSPGYRHAQGEVNALHVALTRNAMAQVNASDANDLDRLAQLADEEDQLAEALTLYQRVLKATPKFVP